MPKQLNSLMTCLQEQKAQNAHLKEKVQNISGQCDENSKLLSNEITLKAEAEKRLLLLSEVHIKIVPWCVWVYGIFVLSDVLMPWSSFT
jgi:hypothetical protein